MASEADYQYIMGTVLGQEDDSPLFKALEMAGATDDVADIVCSVYYIDQLKYRDNSSGTTVTKELGIGYRQLIWDFHAFVQAKNAAGHPIHKDWQNKATKTDFDDYR